MDAKWWQVFTIIRRGIQIVDLGPDIAVTDVHRIAADLVARNIHNRPPVAIPSPAYGVPYMDKLECVQLVMTTVAKRYWRIFTGQQARFRDELHLCFEEESDRGIRV